MDVSIMASAVRPALWESALSSLVGTTCSYEVVFGGHCTPTEVYPFLIKYPFFKYLHVDRIKPAQVYEATRRICHGKTIIYTADDAEYPGDVIGKAYNYWKSQGNEKLILSIQTKESGYNLPVGQLFDMNVHRFYAGQPKFPLMAPLAMMSRKFLEDLGGFDRRYVCGQYENDAVMRAYLAGATVEIFGGPDCYIDIDHLSKSIAIGESKVEADFLNRPFAKGYTIDRSVLENSWEFRMKPDGELAFRLRTPFEPYEETDILTKSQSNNIKELWL